MYNRGTFFIEAKVIDGFVNLLKVPLPEFFLFSYLNLNITLRTSVKKFLICIKREFFMNLIRRSNLPPFWPTIRISLLSV